MRFSIKINTENQKKSLVLLLLNTFILFLGLLAAMPCPNYKNQGVNIPKKLAEIGVFAPVKFVNAL